MGGSFVIQPTETYPLCQYVVKDSSTWTPASTSANDLAGCTTLAAGERVLCPSGANAGTWIASSPTVCVADPTFVVHSGYTVDCSKSRVKYRQTGTTTPAFEVATRAAYPEVRVDWPEFGAKGGGVNDTAAFQRAVDYVIARGGANGGIIWVPENDYRVEAPDANHAAIWVHGPGVSIRGMGKKSRIYTTNNYDTAIHVGSAESFLDEPATEIDSFECEGLIVEGTGVYEYLGLAAGRGILMRKVANGFVRRCFVNSFSMIGICVEHGNGRISIDHNSCYGNKYTAINVNGRGYGCDVSHNYCWGTNADLTSVNTAAIQVTGHTRVTNNWIFGDTVNYAFYGGIMWGEGGFDAVGDVSNNWVLHCRFGIYGIWHGAVSVHDNKIVCCRTLGGILLTNYTSPPSFPVGCSHSVISGNTVLNCIPTAIEASADHSVVVNNVVWTNPAPVVATAATEPDAITVVSGLIGILVGADNVTVSSNIIDGFLYGLQWGAGDFVMGDVRGNTIVNTTNRYSLANTKLVEGVWTAHFMNVPDFEVHTVGDERRYQISSATPPTVGIWAANSSWRTTTPATSDYAESNVIQSFRCAADGDQAGGATALTVSGASSLAVGSRSIVGVECLSGAIHWTSAVSLIGSTLTIEDALPTEGSPSGSRIWVSVFIDGPGGATAPLTITRTVALPTGGAPVTTAIGTLPGTGRWSLTGERLSVASALTGAGSVVARVGSTSGGQEILLDTAAISSSATAGTVVAGETLLSLGSDLSPANGFSASYAAGQVFYLTLTPTGTVTGGSVRATLRLEHA